ncbi:MAG: site-2 protease family protein [bacterium]
MVLTIITFILILGLLVFVHELGHFWIAKRNGVRVDEFGFGFPPRIFGIKKGETLYSINAIPLGGFVKIYGEEGEGASQPRSFMSKGAWQKARILFAGVLMNFFLAVFLFSLGHFIGLPTAIDESQVGQYPNTKLQIVGLAADSPAFNAGILAGDFIVSVKNSEGRILAGIKTTSEFQQFIAGEKGKEVKVVIERGGSKIELVMAPRANPPSDEGPLGVEMASVANIRLSWYQAIWQGFLTTVSLAWLLISTLFFIIANVFKTGRAGVDVVGPVGIFNITGQAVTMGFIYLLQLTAMLSINLAVINAFPFPALDGGRGLFLLIEKIKGSPMKAKTANLVNSIGFALLIALMVFITFRDITKIF